MHIYHIGILQAMTLRNEMENLHNIHEKGNVNLMNKNLDLRLNFVPLSCRPSVILLEELNRLLILALVLFFSCSSHSHSHFYSLPFFQSLKLLFVVPVSCPIFFWTFIPSYSISLSFFIFFSFYFMLFFLFEQFSINFVPFENVKHYNVFIFWSSSLFFFFAILIVSINQSCVRFNKRKINEEPDQSSQPAGNR